MKKRYGLVTAVLALAGAAVLAGCATVEGSLAKGEKSKTLEEAERHYQKALELEPDNAALRAEVNTALMKWYLPLVKAGGGEAYEKALALDPENPDIHFARGLYYYSFASKRDYMAAAAEFGRALEKDPACAVNTSVQSLSLPVATAAGLGLPGLEKNLDAEGISLRFMQGMACYDAVKNKEVPEAAVNETLDKAIDSFWKGYNQDIAGGARNTPDAKTLYLLFLGDALSRRGDHARAATAWTELVNARDIPWSRAGITARLREARARADAVTNYRALAAKGMYYVSAAGSDDNDGLSEATAFRTLGNAIVSTWLGGINAVTVIGTLNQASENRKDEDEVFSISNHFSDKSLLITGIPDAPPAKRAVLSAAGTQKNGVSSYGKLRLEHIEISGSPKTGLFLHVNSDVTLGYGAVVKNNSGGGIVVYGPKDEFRNAVKPGVLTLDGGIVENNKRNTAGAGIIVMGAFTMKWGSVRNNTAIPDAEGFSAGGGINVQSRDPVVIEGGDITGNTAAIGGGIVVDGRVTMTGGTISGNTARIGGGVVSGKNSAFDLRGGTVSGNTSAQGGDIYQNR